MASTIIPGITAPHPHPTSCGGFQLDGANVLAPTSPADLTLRPHPQTSPSDLTLLGPPSPSPDPGHWPWPLILRPSPNPHP